MALYLVIPAGDIALSRDFGDPLGTSGGGSYVIVEGLQQIRQRIASRLQMFLGEWFIDLRQGFPYYRDVFVKSPSLDVVRSLFRRVIAGTPGVLSVPTLDIVFDRKTRRAHVGFHAVCNGGTIVVKPGDEDFIVPRAA